jgi:predicted metal-binding protein
MKTLGLLSTIKSETLFLGPVDAVCNKKVRALCFSPYHNHPKGCPNYGKRSDCPPKVKFFSHVFFVESIYIFAVTLDFESYIKKRKILHPSWSDPALRNPRHWQGHVRALLMRFVNEKKGSVPPQYEIVTNPEAMGVNVTETCKNAGLILEWPPTKKVSKVVLFAKPRS